VKRKLRHPINSIREPFGTAGLIVAMIALVAALGGTALAASGLNSKQKKEVTKIAKKYAGKPGTNGTNGTNGSPGAAGKDGVNGTDGTDGESVTITAYTGEECEEAEGEEGAKFTNKTGTAYACNGAAGTGGGGGGFPATLPSGSTETGTWAGPGTFGITLAPISFPIQLSAPLPESKVHIVSESDSNCPGTAAEPQAAAGNLCVYVDKKINAEIPAVVPPGGEPGEIGAGVSGAFVEVFGGESPSIAAGSWAVKAP
jgi:hypothetical protein